MREFPFTVNDPESDVLVGRPRAEVQKYCFVVTGLFDNLIGRSFGFVDEVRIEDVELVALHNFWRWVVGARKWSARLS